MFSAVQQKEYDDLTLELDPVPLFIVKIVEKANLRYEMKFIYENHPEWVDHLEWLLEEFSTA